MMIEGNGVTISEDYKSHWFDYGVQKEYTKYTCVHSYTHSPAWNDTDYQNKNSGQHGTIDSHKYTWRNDGVSTFKVYVNYDNSKTKAGNNVVNKNINDCVFMKAYFYSDHNIRDNSYSTTYSYVEDYYNAYSTSGTAPHVNVRVANITSYTYTKTVDDINIPNFNAGQSCTGYTDNTAVVGDKRESEPVK